MAKKLTVKIPVLERGQHYITCDYGYYSDNKTWHKGIDLIGDYTKSDTSIDNIIAFADGTVIDYCNSMKGQSYTSDLNGCGNYIFLKHENGWITRYMHMVTGTVAYKTGDKVSKGAILGKMGMTGNATGNHLHFDISNSQFLPYGKLINNRYYADPKPFLLGQKTFKDIGYQKGTYTVVKDVNVRAYPSTSGALIKYPAFTENAKKQIKKITSTKPDYFPAGLRVTISEIRGTWGKCPSGWLSLNLCKPDK